MALCSRLRSSMKLLASLESPLLKSDVSCRVASRVCRSSGNLGLKLGSMKLEETVSPPYLMGSRRMIHSGSPKEFEVPRNARPRDVVRGSSQESRRDLFGRPIPSKNADSFASPTEFRSRGNARSMDFVRGVLEESKKDFSLGSQFTRPDTRRNADIVHMKLLRNNTFVTLTDSRGKRKAGTSAGIAKGKKSESKKSRLACEAAAQHIGQAAKELGSKSVVIKVNGFVFFKRKQQAVLAWRDGYSNNPGDPCPVVYIEDTTRLPHNGCRRPKKCSK